MRDDVQLDDVQRTASCTASPRHDDDGAQPLKGAVRTPSSVVDVVRRAASCTPSIALWSYIIEAPPRGTAALEREHTARE
jgi:hypothetical protein